jgi:hypothetical protein
VALTVEEGKICQTCYEDGRRLRSRILLPPSGSAHNALVGFTVTLPRKLTTIARIIGIENVAYLKRKNLINNMKIGTPIKPEITRCQTNMKNRSNREENV